MKKTICSLGFLAITTFGISAEAKREFTTILIEKMALEDCRNAISTYAKENELDLKEWQENEFYLMYGGGLAGNAYYSEGTCHIYLR